jgi:excisionase family DNA binding protein
MTDPRSKLMTVKEVAEALHASRQAVYDLIYGGQLPVVNLAPPYQRPRYRVDPEDLVAFVNRRRTSLGAIQTARRGAAVSVPNHLGL